MHPRYHLEVVPSITAPVADSPPTIETLTGHAGLKPPVEDGANIFDNGGWNLLVSLSRCAGMVVFENL
jgi:hypothetical protein